MRKPQKFAASWRAKNPNVYLPDVATTLNNVGNLQIAQKRMGAARQECEEALSIYQRFAQRDPEQFGADVARLELLLKALPR